MEKLFSFTEVVSDQESNPVIENNKDSESQDLTHFSQFSENNQENVQQGASDIAGIDLCLSTQNLCSTMDLKR